MATKQTAFRFSDEVLEKMDFLCTVTGDTRTSLLASMVCAEYDRYQGNPELQKLIAQMKDMERQMKSMLGKNDTSEDAPVSVPAPKLGSCSECVNPCKDENDPSEVGLCEHFQPAK
jgi:hypothetical protein